MKRVLITRPVEDSARTAEAVQALGYHVLIAPLFEVRALPVQWQSKPDAVLATSANAIRSCSAAQVQPLLSLPLFTVGDATAEAAKKAGFTHVRSANGNADALADLIRKEQKPGSHLLQLAGRPRRDAAILALGSNYSLETAETYATIAVEHLPEPIGKALNNRSIDVVLHFSLRAAKVLKELGEASGYGEALESLRHIAMSRTAAENSFRTMEYASEPTLDAMLQTLSNCSRP